MAKEASTPDPTQENTVVVPPRGGSGTTAQGNRTLPDRFNEGDQLSEFKLVRRLGQGGMASVWLAEQTSLHREVALKLLSPDLMADDTYVKRFQTEAKAAAGLNHPNIVQVYIIGEADGQHFIAQEYVQGQTLKSYLQKKGVLDLNLGLHILRQVASALQTAGERGIVHRDIKPENIMLTKKGEAKVADFGLAQLTVNGEKLNLTQTGITMGTPLYMSPEQVNGHRLDTRSDLYSLGVTCYHMFGGRPPFQGESAIAVAVQHLQAEPKPLRELRPDLPQPVCDLVARLMAKNPDNRYPTATFLLEDVRKLIKAAKENGRVDQVKLTELSDAAIPRTFAGRHPVIALLLLSLLAGSLSAAVGWKMRPVDPLSAAAGPRQSVRVSTRETVKEQYFHGLFYSQNEDAWLAVLNHPENGPGSQEWKARATEQLALMYLRDQNRWDDARKQLQSLKNIDGPAHDQFAAKASAGEFVLATYQRDFSRARRLFDTDRSKWIRFGILSDSPPPAGGSWRRLIEDAAGLLDEPGRNQRPQFERPAPPPNSPPPPGRPADQ